MEGTGSMISRWPQFAARQVAEEGGGWERSHKSKFNQIQVQKPPAAGPHMSSTEHFSRWLKPKVQHLAVHADASSCDQHLRCRTLHTPPPCRHRGKKGQNCVKNVSKNWEPCTAQQLSLTMDWNTFSVFGTDSISQTTSLSWGTNLSWAVKLSSLLKGCCVAQPVPE